MKVIIEDLDGEKINYLLRLIEDKFNGEDISFLEAYVVSMIVAVGSSDSMELSRDSFIWNCINMWDMYSNKSAEHHQKDMQ